MEYATEAQELFKEYYEVVQNLSKEYYQSINEWIQQTGTEVQIFMAVCTTVAVMLAGYMLIAPKKKKVKVEEQPTEISEEKSQLQSEAVVSKPEVIQESQPVVDTSASITREDTEPQQNGWVPRHSEVSDIDYEEEVLKRDSLIERLERELQASADAIAERDHRVSILSRDLHAVREADRAVNETLTTIASSTNNNPEVLELRSRMKDKEDALHRYRMETESMGEKIMDQMVRIDNLTTANTELEDRAIAAETALSDASVCQLKTDTDISSIRRRYLEAENERERLEHQHHEDEYQLSQLRVAHQQELEAFHEQNRHESPRPPSPPSPSIINELNHLRQQESLLRQQETHLRQKESDLSSAVNGLERKCDSLEARNQQLEQESNDKLVLEARCSSLQDLLSDARERLALLEKQPTVQAAAAPPMPQRSSSSIPPNNIYGSPSRVGGSSPSQVEKLRMSHGLIGQPKRQPQASLPSSPVAADNRAMYVYSEEKPILQGEYKRCGTHNSYPMWASGSFRIFSSTEGFWMVSADAEGPTRNVGRLVSSITHEGAAPDKMTSWDYSNGSNWETSKSTRISASRNPLPVFGSPSRLSPASSSSRGSSFSPTEKRFPVPSCVPRLSLPAVDESRATDYGFPRGWKASETGRVTAPDGRILPTVHEGLAWLHRTKSLSGSPSRRGQQVCTLFAAGRCNSGPACPLLHESVTSLPRERSASSSFLISPPAGTM